MQNNGRSSLNYNYTLLKYTEGIGEYEWISNSDNGHFILESQGIYTVVLNKIDPTRMCYKITNSLILKSLPDYIETQFQKFELNDDNDSIIIYLTNYLHDLEFPLNINWYYYDSLIENENSDFIIIRNPGIYKAKIGNEICDIVSNEINVTDEMMIQGVTRINKVDGISVYPNPASNEIYIKFSESKTHGQLYNYYIYDSNRKIIKEGILIGSNLCKIEIEDNISAGYYLLNVTDSNKSDIYNNLFLIKK